MQMLAEAMTTDFKKGNERCFVCGDRSHLKKDCPKKSQKKLLKSLQESALDVIKGYIGLKNVDLNMMLRESYFGKLKDGDSPGPHQQKPGTNSIFSLKPSTSGSAVIDILALNDFLLFPQAVTSRIPTRLYGPLPSQTFSLILGQSSLTSKEITIHPEIIDSDYNKKNSNYYVISDTMTI